MAQYESGKNTTTLKTYVNDMAGLAKHIHEVLEHQYADERVKNNAQAFALVGDVKNTLAGQVSELNAQVERLGSETMATVKQGITQALGVVAGLYDKVRKDPVSRMLRDDYTALNMASISYTQLHTTALAYHDHAVADLALRHLQALTPLIIRHNEIMPNIVAAELSDEGPGIDTGVGAEATKNTQEAWK